MRIYLNFLAVLAFSVPTVMAAHADERVGVAERTMLQAAVQQHIERNLVDGNYLQLDTVTGQIHTLMPFKPHPVILRMGDYFVLCSDFRNDKGKTVNVDFYVAKRGQSYAVFHSAADGDALLKRLMKEGRVKRLE